MFITKITRSYSKSINLKEYGGPESWVKVESTYEAQVESVDDEKMVSDNLHDRAKADVVAGCNAIVEKVREKVTAAAVKPPVTGGPVPAPNNTPSTPRSL